jgi:hypothetical protein
VRLVCLFALLALIGCEEGGLPVGEGGALACVEGEPVCPVNAHDVDACITDECFTATSCDGEKLCEPGICDAPRCADQNESEVDACGPTEVCRDVDLCGLTIHCLVFCTAVPECDWGDDEGPCPDGAPCYLVEQCGFQIGCVDKGPPHGCPVNAPSEGGACDPLGLTCVISNRDAGCLETWVCQEPPAVPAPVPGPLPEWHRSDAHCTEVAEH